MNIFLLFFWFYLYCFSCLFFQSKVFFYCMYYKEKKNTKKPHWNWVSNVYLLISADDRFPARSVKNSSPMSENIYWEIMPSSEKKIFDRPRSPSYLDTRMRHSINGNIVSTGTLTLSLPKLWQWCLFFLRTTLCF